MAVRASEFSDLPGCVGAGDTDQEEVTKVMGAKKHGLKQPWKREGKSRSQITLMKITLMDGQFILSILCIVFSS